MLFPNWSDYFKSRGDNEMGNKNSNKYDEVWSNPDPKTKLPILTNDPDTVLLAADTEGTMILLHSFTNLGGSLLRPKDKFVCLTGSGHVGVAVIVDETSAIDECNLTTPPVDLIIACKTTTEIKALVDPDTFEEGAVCEYTGTNTFLPAPWLVDAIMATNSNDPFDLILVACTAASEFNDAHNDDPAFLSTQEHLESFVAWAWGVKMERVKKISYRLDLTDPQLTDYQSKRNLHCIAPNHPPLHHGPPPLGAVVPPPGPPPIFAPGAAPTPNDAILQQLAASISRQSDEAAAHNELVTRQLELSVEKEEKKKDRFKKLHSSTKQLIIFASAEDADDVPSDVTESCKRFINAETTGVAEQELNLQFKNLGLQDAAFSPGLTQALYAGKFLWADKGTPSNFSPFSIFEVEPLLAADQQNRHLILHLVETQGKGKTLDEIKASSKQEVKAPTTYMEMVQQLKFFAGLCEIFFGDLSVACCSIKALVAIVERNRHILKARETDKTFMSQFLFAVDTRFQLWLDECMSLPSRDQVDDTMLNFHPIIDSVRFGTFSVTLPITFVSTNKTPDPDTHVKPNNKRTGDGNNGAGGGGGETAQKSKKQRRDTAKVKNSSPPDSCKLLAGETWATHFAHKGFNERVDWDGSCKMCPRWFIRGYCYSDCINAPSHVTEDSIPADKLAAFQQFMRSCRNA